MFLFEYDHNTKRRAEAQQKSNFFCANESNPQITQMKTIHRLQMENNPQIKTIHRWKTIHRLHR